MRQGFDESALSQAFAEAAARLKAKFGEEALPMAEGAVEMAEVLQSLRLDRQSLLAALLHPALAHNLYSPAELETRFGKEFAALALQVAKLAPLSFNPEAKQDQQVQSFRKMILAMASDIRVIFLWLVARLVLLRSLAARPASSASARTARETLDIYSPLAGRLGIGTIKSELENLAFKLLHPAEYEHIDGYLTRYQRDKSTYVEETLGAIRGLLAENDIAGTVYGRLKQPYSTWRKLRQKELGLEQLYDLIAFRVIVPDLEDCYRVLGLVHSLWHPIQGMFEDYIALPKPNGYQSLHTLVIGSHGERMEIQIRTRAMHEVAENGLAAHWHYKETGGSRAVKAKEEGEVALVRWLKQLLAERDPNEANESFFDTLKLDLFSDVIFVFTPKGDVIELPQNASVIDAAFAIHTQVGLHASGAKINGRLVPFKTALKSGDVIEILTHKAQTPHKEWLEFTLTNRAKSKIRHAIRETEREASRVLGHELCEREFKRFGLNLNRLEKSGELDKLELPLRLRDFSEALIAIGRGKLRVRDILLLLAPEKVAAADALAERQAPQKPQLQVPRTRHGAGSGVVIDGLGDMVMRFARCCRPVPGDPILGYVTRGRGLTIHHAFCPKLERDEQERLLEAAWDEASTTQLAISIKVKIVDKPGMIRTVSHVLETRGINIDAMHARARRGHGEVVFAVTINTLDELDSLLSELRRVKGVLLAERLSARRSV